MIGWRGLPVVDGVERFVPVCPDRMIGWITSVPISAWTGVHMSDLRWQDFGEWSEPCVRDLMSHFPGNREGRRMVSRLSDGHGISEHVDEQPPNWVIRIHVPLITNPEAAFIVSGVPVHMDVGWSYKVDTRVPHAVDSGGGQRIHFMFDVYQ